MNEGITMRHILNRLRRLASVAFPAAPSQAATSKLEAAPAPSPGKGELGGVCWRPSCDASPANWYNREALAHYCEECAGMVNMMNTRPRPVCTAVIGHGTHGVEHA